VQRPGVRRDTERDVELMKAMVWLFTFRLRRLYFMRDPVRELAAWTQDELDYRHEAAPHHWAERRTHPRARAEVYWDLTRAACSRWSISTARRLRIFVWWSAGTGGLGALHGAGFASVFSPT
jgi:hypothetical protein